MRRLFVGLSFLAMTTAVFAQPTGYEYFQTHDLTWPGSSGYGSGDFGESCAGRFTPFSRNSAIIIRGDVPVLVMEPTAFNTFVAVGTQANDVATLRFENWAAVRYEDAFFGVGPNGLQLWAFLPNLNAVSVTIDNSGPYLGAHYVRVADVNGDFLDDVVVLSADRTQVLVKVQTGAGTFVPSNTYTGFTYGGTTIHDVVVGDFDLNATGLEVALLTDSGVGFYELDGTHISSYSSPQSSLDCIAVLSGSGTSNQDQIFWSAAVSGANPDRGLYTVDPSMPIPYLHESTSLPVVRATSCRLNEGDYSDILLSTSDDDALYLMYSDTGNAGTREFSLDPSMCEVLDLPGTITPTGPKYSEPVVSDFDYDDAEDLVYPIVENLNVRVINGPLSRPAYDWDGIREVSLALNLSMPKLGHLFVGADAPTYTTLILSLGVNYGSIDSETKLELITSSKPRGMGNIDNSVSDDPVLLQPLVDPTSGAFYCEIEGLDVLTLDYFFYLRVLDYDQGVLVDTGSPLHACLSTDSPASQFKNYVRSSYAYSGWLDFEDVMHDQGEPVADGWGQRLNGLIRTRRAWGGSTTGL